MPPSVTAEAPVVVEMGSMRPSPFANSVEPLEEEAPLLVSGGDTLLNGVPEETEAGQNGGSAGGKDVKEFTLRAVVAGLVIGALLCGSNMHFGLQTGWVTMGSVQSAVLGFGLFKAGQRVGCLRDFTVAENVIVQTTAVATATMPLAAGFVGVVPALSKLTPEENPPHGAVLLSTGQLLAWAAALAFFGVFIAVPLRTQTILREKLRFPSGTATAQIIRTLFGIDPNEPAEAVANMRTGAGPTAHTATVRGRPVVGLSRRCSNAEDRAKLDCRSLSALARADTSCTLSTWQGLPMHKLGAGKEAEVTGWDTPWRVLVWTFAAACAFTLASAWAPALKALPVLTWLGFPAATAWGWVLAPALGYVGQGMIMGTKTSLSMLLGALLGYAALGPVARARGWAPGAITDWRDGASGWVIWVSLAVMLGDSAASLSLLLATSLRNWRRRREERDGGGEAQHCRQIPGWWWGAGLAASTAVCTAVLAPMFRLPPWQPPVAVLVAGLRGVSGAAGGSAGGAGAGGDGSEPRLRGRQAVAGDLRGDQPRAGAAQPGGRGRRGGGCAAGRGHDAGLQDGALAGGVSAAAVRGDADRFRGLRTGVGRRLPAVHLHLPDTGAPVPRPHCRDLAGHGEADVGGAAAAAAGGALLPRGRRAGRRATAAEVRLRVLRGLRGGGAPGRGAVLDLPRTGHASQRHRRRRRHVRGAALHAAARGGRTGSCRVAAPVPRLPQQQHGHPGIRAGAGRGHRQHLHRSRHGRRPCRAALTAGHARGWTCMLPPAGSPHMSLHVLLRSLNARRRSRIIWLAYVVWPSETCSISEAHAELTRMACVGRGVRVDQVSQWLN